MPFLPEIPTWGKEVINTQQFLGLNRGLSIADGEMADMLNMSSDNFPVLSTRKLRGMPQFDYNAAVTPTFEGEIDGMLGTDRLVVCHNGKVYIDGVEVPITLSTEPAKRKKKLVNLGAYVCIWPDKKYFNINDPEDSGDMGIKWTATEEMSISAMMCRLDGTDYDMTQIVVSDVAPTDPADRDFWLDTGGENHVLMQYSLLYRQWVQVATTYIKIQAPGIGKGLKDNDVVWLSGVHEPGTSAGDEGGEDLKDTYGSMTFNGRNAKMTDGCEVTVISAGYYSLTGLFDEIPSDTQTIAIGALPEKAKATKATLKFKVKSALKSVTQATANGYPIDATTTAEQSVDVVLPSSNKVSVKFTFRMDFLQYGTNPGTHYETLEITDVRIVVDYVQTHYVGSDYDELNRLNTTNVIYGAGDDYIIVAGLLHKTVTLENTLALEMKVPDLDYICEANNRIWGCCYAEQDGKIVNEIKCCALGDFRNWDRYIGIATDSYTMSVGSDGVFTGAFSLQGVPMFFKEAFIHRISGTVPANYTLNTIRGRGVQDGSYKSLVVVNETLFYKARNEIMAYEGALPHAVSGKLGHAYFQNAVGGSYRDKYYINMQEAGADGSGKWHTYVLDTAKGLWHQEDMRKISHMAMIGGELVLACENEDTTDLLTVGNRTGAVEDPFEWSITFGVMGYQDEQQKYLSRYNIRAQLGQGSRMKVEMQYDSDGKWMLMGIMKSARLQTFLLPIIPRRCDHCQLRISGTGTINLYSVAREYESGGDG